MTLGTYENLEEAVAKFALDVIKDGSYDATKLMAVNIILQLLQLQQPVKL